MKKVFTIFLAAMLFVGVFSLPAASDSTMEITGPDIAVYQNGEYIEPGLLTDGMYKISAQVKSAEGNSFVFAAAHTENGIVKSIAFQSITLEAGEERHLELNMEIDGVKSESALKCFVWPALDMPYPLTGMKVLDTKLPYCDILSFEIPELGEYKRGYILPAQDIPWFNPDEGYQTNTNRIWFFVPSGMPVSSLTPQITLSEKAQITPGPGTPINFDKDVKFTVTAENGTTKEYTVHFVRFGQSGSGYYSEDFEAEDVGTVYDQKFDSATGANIYTLNSGNTFTMTNATEGEAYSVIEEIDGKKAIKLVDESTSSAAIRFPNGTVQMSAGPYVMVKLRFCGQSIVRPGGANIAIGNLTRIFIDEGENNGFKVYAPEGLSNSFNSKNPDAHPLLAELAPNEWVEICVLTKASSTILPETYYFVNGTLVEEASGTNSNLVRGSLNMASITSPNSSQLHIWLDELFIAGGN